MSNDFLPVGYEVPTSGGGYAKLETGENKFRILSSPLMTWLEWRDGKTKRHRFVNKEETPAPAKGTGEKDSVKHAWALIVWNYKTEKIELLEIDKQGVIAAIKALSEKPAWGHPKNYDIVISKKGSDLKTEYMTTPEPPSPVSSHIVEAYTENPIDLNQLMVEGGNPFISKDVAANPANLNAQPVSTSEKVVTPENWVAGDKVPAGHQVNPDTGALEKKKLPFD